MRLLDTISFDALPPAENASAKTTSRTFAGSLFQNVLQQENGMLSVSEKGGEDSSESQLEQLLKELENFLSGKNGAELDEDWLSAFQSLDDVSASQEELALAEQLLHKLRALLGDAVEMQPSEETETFNEEASLGEEPETKEPKLPDSNALSQIQQLLSLMIHENHPSQKASQIAELFEKAPAFLAALQTKAGSEGLAEELKRQFFTKDPSQSQLLAMSTAELKSLKSVMEQMMNDSSETGQKEWKLAESELKAMLMNKKIDIPIFDKPLSFILKNRDIQENGKPVLHEQPIQSNGLMNQHRTGTALLQGLQAGTADEASAQPKSFPEQILSSWKQMKFTPFGRSTGSFTIRLNPENLGFITIKLVKQHGMFSSKIIASTESAKELLEHNLTHLKQALPNMAVQIDRFGVPVQNGDQTLGQSSDDQKNHQQQKQDQEKDQENDDFREFLDELIETRVQDSEEEI
ncbi:flagellar hook-length control protein FliK [Bacillus swezeyi]|uniref:flagellar hook-length control protein FliK n=1 Tax=Bacillus swezeyi TaxID=1925020 RepID=UPI002E1CB7A3|nr:flagellar hook-length control protein FliK [Bacillus swezeyi]